MSKNINIEHCSSWGMGKSAERLQNILKQAFPEYKVNLSKSKEKLTKLRWMWKKIQRIRKFGQMERIILKNKKTIKKLLKRSNKWNEMICW